MKQMKIVGLRQLALGASFLFATFVMAQGALASRGETTMLELSQDADFYDVSFKTNVDLRAIAGNGSEYFTIKKYRAKYASLVMQRDQFRKNKRLPKSARDLQAEVRQALAESWLSVMPPMFSTDALFLVGDVCVAYVQDSRSPEGETNRNIQLGVIKSSQRFQLENVSVSRGELQIQAREDDAFFWDVGPTKDSSVSSYKEIFIRCESDKIDFENLKVKELGSLLRSKSIQAYLKVRVR